MLEVTEEMKAAVAKRMGGQLDPWMVPAIKDVLALVERDLNAGWLIWSRQHDAWWKPEERGYTSDMMCAGRYDRERADRIASVRKMHDGSPGEVVVRPPEISLVAAPNLMEKMRGRIAAATRAAKAVSS